MENFGIEKTHQNPQEHDHDLVLGEEMGDAANDGHDVGIRER